MSSLRLAAPLSLDGPAARAAAAIRATPRHFRWFLDCDTDADGLCAAAVVAVALRRDGRRFQVRASRDKTAEAYAALAAQDADGFILLDKGTSHIGQLDRLCAEQEKPVLVIDHHNLIDAPQHVVLVNPRAEGMDGSRDASAATTAAALALALDEGNLDLAGTALAGAVGDWQHDGGWQGWNARLRERALEAGHLRETQVPALVGVDLANAVWQRIPGHKDADAARQWLQEHGIDPSSEAEMLSPEQATTLLSDWTLRLLAEGASDEALARTTWPLLVDARTGLGVRHLFRVLDACGRLDDAATGLAWMLGDASAKQAAFERFDAYKRDLSEAIRHLQTEGTTAYQAMQHAGTAAPAYTGMVAGLGMTHFLADRTRPVVITAPRPDGDLQVSTRGSNDQVDRGLDLGAAIQVAAKQVGCEGGGHPVASGAVVPADRLDDLLKALDEALMAQGFLEAA